jgi:hypothetical protein
MKMRKTMRSADHAYHPVKIAVLDTGLKSNWCFGNVTYRDFVDPKREGRVDNTSHGTASVDLILHAYPEAELYVGRVFNTNQTDERTEPALLAEVGEHSGCHRVMSGANKYRLSIGRLRKGLTSLTSLLAFGMTMFSSEKLSSKPMRRRSSSLRPQQIGVTLGLGLHSQPRSKITSSAFPLALMTSGLQILR